MSILNAYQGINNSVQYHHSSVLEVSSLSISYLDILTAGICDGSDQAWLPWSWARTAVCLPFREGRPTGRRPVTSRRVHISACSSPLSASHHHDEGSLPIPGSFATLFIPQDLMTIAYTSESWGLLLSCQCQLLMQK